MNTITAATWSTPDGPFTVLTDATHVLASGWTENVEELLGLIHPSLQGRLETDNDAEILQQAHEAVRRYYDGDLTEIAEVPVRQRSGPFRQAAWEALRAVEAGCPLTYAEYAVQAGSPGAVRAAAGACAQNAAALFVPCHRVIRTDGRLGGFRYGLALKQSLLTREAAARR